MRALLASLPLLVCPLMMGAMMWFMARGRRDRSPGEDASARAVRIAQLEAELGRRQSALHADPPAERLPNS